MTQTVSSTVTCTFAYDADGARVKRCYGATTTYYIGNYFEVAVSGGVTTTTKYYYFGAQRVAMRTSAGVTYLHGDHLGSSNVASNSGGALVSRQTYYPFGTMRAYDAAPMTSVTDFNYTGQRVDSYIKLLQMGTRWHSCTATTWAALTPRTARRRLAVSPISRSVGSVLVTYRRTTPSPGKSLAFYRPTM